MHRLLTPTLLLMLALLLAPAASAQNLETLWNDSGPSLPPSLERLATRLAAVAEDDRLQETITQNLEGDVWVNSSRTTYTYDGTSIQDIVIYNWTGEAWQESSWTHYVHDNGKLTSYSYATWTTGWVHQYRVDYEYEGDVMSRTTDYDWDGTQWTPSGRETYTTQNGLIVGGIEESWDGTAWTPASRFTITQEGADVVTVDEEAVGSTWVNSERVVYHGITIEQLYLNVFDLVMEEDPELTALLVAFPPSTSQTWVDGLWVNESQTVVEYDGSDNPIEVMMSSWLEDAWQAESRYQLTYEGDSKLDTLRMQFYDEGEWMTLTTMSHEYDDKGRLAISKSEADFIVMQIVSRTLYRYGDSTVPTEEADVPVEWALDPAYPNPFNPSTRLTYHVGATAPVAIRVYDALGRQVADLFSGVQPAGRYEVTFEAAGLGSGLYFIRMEAGGQVRTQAVTLVR